MKKQELIHLHGLLSEVRAQFEAWDECEGTSESYRELGVRPTSIHRSKTDHKHAVFALVEGITSDLSETTEDPVSATAD